MNINYSFMLLLIILHVSFICSMTDQKLTVTKTESHA